MKSNKRLLILLMALLSLAILASCTITINEPQDTAASTENVTEADTSNESLSSDTSEESENGTTEPTGTGDAESGEDTSADTDPAETETEMPRYNYFDAEVGLDVTLDKSAYQSMTLKLSPDLLITDEQVQDYLQYLIFQERTAVNGDTKVYDQALKLGDTAYIYYRGTVDGVEFSGGSNMEDESPFGLGLGSGSFIPGFEEGLVGVIPNQTSKDNPAEVHVTFPEGYNAELGGKDAIFYVVVEYAVQYTLPEYTREFVETALGYESNKTHVTDKSFLNEFEDFLKTYLEEQNAEYVESAKTDALWTYLTDTAVCVNLPQIELDYYITSYKNELTAAYEYYSTGTQKDAFLKLYPTIGDFAVYYMGFESGTDWEEEINKLAELMVKKDMIVHAIAEWENMETVTEEDLQEEIEYWIEYYGGYVTEEDILENIGEEYLRESAFAVKMYDYLIANCTFEYTE